MTPGKGTMLIFNQRMTDTVINRCHKPTTATSGAGPLVAIWARPSRTSGPDVYGIGRDEVALLMVEGAKLFPDLAADALSAYAAFDPCTRKSDEGGR